MLASMRETVMFYLEKENKLERSFVNAIVVDKQ